MGECILARAASGGGGAFKYVYTDCTVPASRGEVTVTLPNSTDLTKVKAIIATMGSTSYWVSTQVFSNTGEIIAQHGDTSFTLKLTVVNETTITVRMVQNTDAMLLSIIAVL